MTNAEAKVEVLLYAIKVCDTRKAAFKTPGYNLACDEIKMFLEAAIERIKAVEDMTDYAYFQKGLT